MTARRSIRLTEGKRQSDNPAKTRISHGLEASEDLQARILYAVVRSYFVLLEQICRQPDLLGNDK